MREIRSIPQEQLDDFVDLYCDAYPGMNIVTAEEKKKLKDRYAKTSQDPRRTLYGMYDNSALLGGIILFDYRMNLFGHIVSVGGAGSLAVNLLHKKEYVARDLMKFFFEHYRDNGSLFATLWPFRPDFYRQMGCGYGSKIDQYKIKPSQLPKTEGKEHVRFLTADDAPALLEFYNRMVDRHTGMIEETLQNLQTTFEVRERWKWVGFFDGDRITGYMIFFFERGLPGNFVDNHINIMEMQWENGRALAGLMSFLRTQFDQISLIKISTNDEDFHHLLADPRNDTGNLINPVYHESNVSGVGIMFRVLDTPAVFTTLKDHSFGGVDCKLKLNIKDSFLPQNDSSLVVHFAGGKPSLESGGSFDVEVTMDIADFSSMLLGAVSFKSLHDYGRAEISDNAQIGLVSRAFATEEKPVCLTSF